MWTAPRQPSNPYPENTRKGRSYDLGYYYGQHCVDLSRACREGMDFSVQFTEGHRYGEMDQDIILS